jgi:hypothetical protein
MGLQNRCASRKISLCGQLGKVLADSERTLVDLFFEGGIHGSFHEIAENSGQYQNYGNDYADDFAFKIQSHAGSCRVIIPVCRR